MVDKRRKTRDYGRSFHVTSDKVERQGKKMYKVGQMTFLKETLFSMYICTFEHL